MLQRLFILAILAVLQSACTIAPIAPAPRGPAAPPAAKRVPSPAVKSYPLPTPAPVPEVQAYPTPTPAPVPTTEPAPPAVIALIRQAELDRRQGDLERAATRIERALRIQPQNAELWHTLAKVRLEQHQPRLAEELAKKSISLTGERDLRRRNWQLIAEARRLNGDIAGARLAEQEAGRY